MKGFKRCDNGHYYNENLERCPYCPQSKTADTNSNQSEKTQFLNDTNQEQENSSQQKTQLFGGGVEQVQQNIFGGGQQQPVQEEKQNDIYMSGFYETPENLSGGSKTIISPQRTQKRLVGWLVSFTIDPMGIDFKLYEGKNTIGRNATCDVTITSDLTISAEHATILHIENEFLLEDSLSTGGTFLNGQRLRPRTVHNLHDGDQIKFANTVFKFKSAL